MNVDSAERTTQIVAVGSQGLTTRSASIALRGLKDLVRESNWLVKKVFAGPIEILKISPKGSVAGFRCKGLKGSDSIEVFGIEGAPAAPIELGLLFTEEEKTGTPPGQVQGNFAWSPSGDQLVAATTPLKQQLQYFDFLRGGHGTAFGAAGPQPTHLSWSSDGGFLAAARSGGADARVSLWRAQNAAFPFSNSCESELGFPGWIERQTYEVESGEDGAFLGYGRLAFSPDGRALAVAAEFQGEWADDSITIVDVPGMSEQLTHPVQGHVTDIAWARDGRELVYCASGQAYRLDLETMDAEALPFGAEWCASHPELPVCVCYSGWLKNSAKGRLFLVDLQTLRVFDEHAAESVADVRWGSDGTKAYAITTDGLAYVYEPDFL
ncbi:MAG TPA: hypothetical protein VMU43_14815 [Candidatus Acidoferrum sp.]|nr:hypothetical protein [Candidatus Acidoferrum sp.]